MLYKTCPRCNGDLYLERGTGYAEFVCLQCGHRRSPEQHAMDGSALRRERELSVASKRAAA